MTRNILMAILGLVLLVGATPVQARPHSADTAAPFGVIDLSELLRVIQFYNSPSYHCEVGTEDGYAPGPGETTCLPHDSDYLSADYVIGLSELLRAIQFYNSLAYSTSCGTEDNYAPGPGSLGDCSSEGEGEGQALPRVPELLSIAGDTFIMGNSGVPEDAGYGQPNEFPAHSVTLSSYSIGKFEVTNAEFASVLNWANAPARAYLRNEAGEPWAGTGNIYGGANLKLLIALSSVECDVVYSGGIFSAKSRSGIPAGTLYSMAEHPAQNITWYGAVLYCNWLSEALGRTPVYDTLTWDADFSANGYRLPTEAEWERAAAWDGSKHWIFGTTTDSLTGASDANYNVSLTEVLLANPLGLDTAPYTVPVGWYNGLNTNPNGGALTNIGVSPVGAFGMAGNVWEWCHDWYGEDYYAVSPSVDPVGPSSGERRILRGGSWDFNSGYTRTAYRNWYDAPGDAYNGNGFRVAVRIY